MKVLICGDRNWTNQKKIEEEIIKTWKEFKCPPRSEIIIIHGGARGADNLAGEVAKELGLKVKVFPADWERFGKAAGPMRNIEMLNEKPDLVLAFHNDLSKSKGTAHTVRTAEKRGMKVKVISEEL